MPLPVPAAARLLTGFSLVPIEGSIETVTPTGAAILASLCAGSARALPALRLLATGTGMGTAELPGRANVLRVLLGEAVPAGADAPRGEAVVIEAAIDDMDPRLYGEVAQRLFAAGALDVALVPLQMKKGRPGTLLSVLARPELEGVLSGLLLRETTTLGVRSHDVRRTELARRHETIETRFGEPPFVAEIQDKTGRAMQIVVSDARRIYVEGQIDQKQPDHPESRNDNRQRRQQIWMGQPGQHHCERRGEGRQSPSRCHRPFIGESQRK